MVGRKRKRTSVSWEYFTESEDGSTAKCNLCSKEVSTTGGTTSGMGRHLQAAHNEVINAGAKRSRTEGANFSLKPEEVVSQLAAMDGIPFRVIASSTTIRFMFEKSNQCSLPHSANTIRDWVLKFYEDKKSAVKREIEDTKTSNAKLSVTLDEWTSAASKRYMNVNLHGIGGKFWNLGLVRINGSFTSEECLSLLTSKLDEYNIDLYKDVLGIVTDGAAVMKRFGQLSKRKQQLCFAHGIHLAVIDVLYDKGQCEESDDENGDDEDEDCDEADEDIDVLAEEPGRGLQLIGCINDVVLKVRRIVRKFRKSPRKQEVLGSYTDNGMTLILDSKTRWNSLLAMLERFMDLKDGVRKALWDLNEEWEFEHGELAAIQELITILQPVKVAVEFMCCRDANLITTDASIQVMMTELSHSTSDLGTKLYAALKKRILERRTSLSEVLSYLHYKKIMDHPGHASGYFGKLTLPQITSTIKQLYETIIQPQPESVSESVMESDSESQSLLLEISLVDKFKNAVNLAKSGNPNEGPCVTRPSRDHNAALLSQIKKEMNDLERWKGRGPILRSVYDSLLTIPPCSVESERAFSSANNFCRKIRARLSDRALNALVFLKAYFQSKQMK